MNLTELIDWLDKTDITGADGTMTPEARKNLPCAVALLYETIAISLASRIESPGFAVKTSTILAAGYGSELVPIISSELFSSDQPKEKLMGISHLVSFTYSKYQERIEEIMTETMHIPRLALLRLMSCIAPVFMKALAKHWSSARANPDKLGLLIARTGSEVNYDYLLRGCEVNGPEYKACRQKIRALFT